MDTLECKIDYVAPIYILLTSFFFIIVFIFSWFFFLNSIMYSKLGINFPLQAITAFFNSGINPCSSSGLFLSLFTICGIHCFNALPKCIAKSENVYMRHMRVSMAESQLPNMGTYIFNTCCQSWLSQLCCCSRKMGVQVECTLANIKSSHQYHK